MDSLKINITLDADTVRRLLVEALAANGMRVALDEGGVIEFKPQENGNFVVEVRQVSMAAVAPVAPAASSPNRTPATKKEATNVTHAPHTSETRGSSDPRADGLALGSNVKVFKSFEEIGKDPDDISEEIDRASAMTGPGPYAGGG
jgi:hypothetical protein